MADHPVDLSKPTQPSIDWTLLAKMALETGMLNTVPTNPAPQQPDFSVRVTPADGVRPEPTPWTNTAIRMGGGIAGGLLGSLLGPVGTAAGAALGTTLASNEFAQPREVAQGTRAGVNPLVGAVEGGANMLPIARFAGLRSLPAVAGSAAAGSAAGSAGVQLAETGSIDPKRTLQETVAGTALGVGIPVGLRGVQALPKVATRVAQAPGVQRVLADETGAVGPDIKASEVTPSAPETFVAPPEGAAPARMAEDVDRHVATLKRLGQDDDAINESVFFHTQVLDDPMAQAQRGISEPQAVTLKAGEELRAAGAFEVPVGQGANKVKFSVEEAAALRQEYAVREEFLIRLRDQMGPDLRTRLQAGDLEAAATVRDLSAKYGVNGIDGLERLKKETALAALEASIADKVVGTAQGRGLALRKARISLKHVPDADFLRVATEKGLPVEEADKLLDTLPTAEQRFFALRKLSQPSVADKWKQIIYTALLSHPATHMVNLEGTSASIVAREALANTVVTGVDRARAAVTGTPRRIATPPADLMGKAYYQGLKFGFRSAGFFLKQGYDPATFGDNVDVNIPLEAFTGKVTGPLMQAPTRFLGAADAFMAQAPYWGEVMRRATAKAMNDAKVEGLDANALRDRITLYAKDHELDDALVESVNSYVKTALFKQDPGPGTRWVGQGVKMLDEYGKKYLGGAPIGTMLLPFRGTPASITRQGFKLVGGGLVTGAKAAKAGDSVQATRDVAEAVIGLGLIASIVLDLTDGTIEVVGDLPKNEFEREASYGQGMQGWSIKVRERYYPASSLGPVAIPISIAASYMQAFKADPKRPMDAFSTVVAPAIRTMLDSTMLKGTNDFLSGIREERKAEQLVGRTVTTNIPYAGALRFTRDQVDPYMRDPGGPGATARFLGGDGSGAAGIGGKLATFGRNITEEVEATLPGLSENVRPRIDSFGEPIERPGTMRRVIGSPSAEDPVRQEMVRLKSVFPTWEDDGLYPGNLEAGITQIEGSYREQAAEGVKNPTPLENFRLTDKERTTYKVVVGGAIGDVLTAVVNHPSYAALSDQEKAEVLRNERVRARKIGLEMFKEIVAPDVEARLRTLRGGQ